MGATNASSVLRGLTAAGLLLSAVVHLELWAQGIRVVPVIGEAFVVNAVAGFALGLLVLTWRNPLPLLGSVAFGLGTLGAFLASITVGLFGFREQAAGVPQLLAAIAEVAAVVFAVAALAVEHRHPLPRTRSRREAHGVLNTSPVHRPAGPAAVRDDAHRA